MGGQSGEGERLTSDAPHNGGRHPPRGLPSATPTASNAGSQGRMLSGRCWVPRPHPPHPGHTGRRTPAARPRGRTAGGGTAPDTGRPSQRLRATFPGDGPPPPPRHTAPTGHTGQGDSDGPPHSHARARSTRVTDPNTGSGPAVLPCPSGTRSALRPPAPLVLELACVPAVDTPLAPACLCPPPPPTWPSPLPRPSEVYAPSGGAPFSLAPSILVPAPYPLLAPPHPPHDSPLPLCVIPVSPSV